MKVSLNWIKEFTDIKLPVDVLVAKIGAQLGEVESVTNLGERYDNIIVAKVISCEKHPDADKLNVCFIDDGKKATNVNRNKQGYVQVVCGAPNVRRGITVAWIPPGAVVPSTYDSEQFRLEARKLRGVVSNGMLASGKELAINDDHEGILILDKPAQPGALLKDVYKLDDYIVDIENKMFTHRPDCFGQLGVAREIAGIQGLKFTSPDWYLDILDKLTVATKSILPLEVKNQLPDDVPRFMAVPMSGVNVAKSPIMVQSFLSRIGVKPINNIVDITNFVMSLTAQPLHAYDYDKVAAEDNAKTATLIVRKPKKGETLALLNGKTIEPRPDAIMIATKKKLIGVGGVMGGSTTEVDATTKNIILECGSFDMYSIRRTSMAHGLFTDAVTRFNKGQSPRQNDKILAYSVAWVNKLAGGEIAGKVQDERNDVPNLKPIRVTHEFINSRLGSELSEREIAKLLSNVEFYVEIKKSGLYVTPPYWRTDIAIPEDIVEEVGRLYGYDQLPLQLPVRNAKPAPVNSLLGTKATVRQVLSAAGANELLTYSFVHGKLFDAVGQDMERAFQLSNALSPELQYYRLSLLPSLLDKVRLNVKAGYDQFALFEINKVHDKTNIHDDGLPAEAERVALVFAANAKASRHYNGSAYYQARKYADHLLASLGFVAPNFEPVEHDPVSVIDQQMFAPFERSRAAYVKTSDGKLLGVIGELRPAVMQNLKLPMFTAGFELNLSMLEQYRQPRHYQALARFPASQQDISLKVPQSTQYSDVEATVLATLGAQAEKHGYHTSMLPLDIYHQANAKSKHITLRIEVTHPDRTLVTAEVNALLDAVALTAKKMIKAERI